MYVMLVCPRSSDPFYMANYYIKWVPTSWTHSKHLIVITNIETLFDLNGNERIKKILLFFFIRALKKI